MPFASTTPGVSPPMLSQSATIGVPAPPKSRTLVAGPVASVLRAYQVRLLQAALAQRTTAGVSVPLPSQSPTTGMSPGRPKLKTRLDPPALLLLRTYQVRPRTTPTVFVPSP